MIPCIRHRDNVATPHETQGIEEPHHPNHESNWSTCKHYSKQALNYTFRSVGTGMGSVLGFGVGMTLFNGFGRENPQERTLFYDSNLALGCIVTCVGAGAIFGKKITKVALRCIC